jgi:hypothetical protein
MLIYFVIDAAKNILYFTGILVVKATNMNINLAQQWGLILQ